MKDKKITPQELIERVKLLEQEVAYLRETGISREEHSQVLDERRDSSGRRRKTPWLLIFLLVLNGITLGWCAWLTFFSKAPIVHIQQTPFHLP